MGIVVRRVSGRRAAHGTVRRYKCGREDACL